MGMLLRFVRALPHLAITLVLGTAVVYFVFVYDSSSQSRTAPPSPTASRAAPSSAVAPGATLDSRLADVEKAVATFEQKHQHVVSSAEASGWYSEKILRLITVVSIIGTFMTLLGYFPLSNLKANTDESQKQFETSRKNFLEAKTELEQIRTQATADFNHMKEIGAQATAEFNEMNERLEQMHRRATADVDEMKAIGARSTAEFNEMRDRLEQIHRRATAVAERIVADGRRLGLDALGGPDLIYVTIGPKNQEIEYHDTAVTAWTVYADLPWSVYDTLGRYFLSTEQLEKALVRLGEAIDRNAEAHAAKYLRGYCLAFMARQPANTTRRQDLLRESERAFEAAHRGDPLNAVFLLGMGWISDEKKQFSDAIDWYRQALASRPDLTEAKYNIVCALAKDGQPEAAYNALFEIKDEPVVRKLLLEPTEVDGELKAIRDWDEAKFRALLGDGQAET